MEELVEAIRAAADPESAAVLTRFFQVRPGGYGEGDVFVGVQLSRLRRLTKPYLRTPFVAADWLPLLRSPVHEDRLAALVVMAERATRAGKIGDDAERRHLFETYLANTASVNNWDLVDVSAAEVVGGFLVDRDRVPLDGLVHSTVLWERRIAMIATHYLLRRGESADTYRIATLLLDDPADLIHKAVGWSLREAGKRVDATELRRFLDRYAATMPRTSLRYAIEHFAPVERQRYLQLR